MCFYVMAEDVASGQVPAAPGEAPGRLNPDAARQLQHELIELQQQQQWQQQLLISQFKQRQDQLSKQHQQQQHELIRVFTSIKIIIITLSFYKALFHTRRAIIVKCLAQGHKCHDRDSNPHTLLNRITRA